MRIFHIRPPRRSRRRNRGKFTYSQVVVEGVHHVVGRVKLWWRPLEDFLEKAYGQDIFPDDWPVPTMAKG